MVESLSTLAMRMPIRFGAVFWLIGVMATCAHADILRDPTRPPAALEMASQGSGADGDVGPKLQSVLISPSRRVAVVSGQTVTVGDKIGESQLVKISEGEVVLRNGKILQTLKLFPDVEKRPVAKRAAPKPDFGNRTIKDK